MAITTGAELCARTYRVRFAECDGLGHVNSIQYLRYLHETELAALEAAGPAAREARWQTATIEIEYLRPVIYGESLTVATRVMGIFGPDLWRRYEFLAQESGELAAWAQTHARLMAPTTGQPMAIPQSLAADLWPGGGPGAIPSCDPFPVAPPPPPGAFRLRRRVRWQELSMAGRMEDATYFDFFAENGMGALEAVGWPIQRMVSEGFAIVMRRHQAEFLAPAHLGDELELATWVSNMKRATGTRHYTITRLGDGELLARMRSLGVWVELATGRPIRVPPGLLDDFAPSIAW